MLLGIWANEIYSRYQEEVFDHLSLSTIAQWLDIHTETQGPNLRGAAYHFLLSNILPKI
jgi:hypothetical protein